MPLDMSDDWRVWDGMENIAYTRTRREQGGDDDVFLAKRRAVSKSERIASGGAYLASDLAWIIPQKLLVQGFVPTPADVITDKDGVAWTVIEAPLGKQRETWKLLCRNLALVFNLQDVVNIELAEVVYDASGAAKRLWPTATQEGDELGGRVLYRSLACKVQPQVAEVVEERGLRGQQETFSIPVARQLTMIDVRECRIHWPKEQVYLDIDRYVAAEQITELPRLEARIRA